MTYQEILNQLAGLGTEQNQKINKRLGSGNNTYGVSLANLRKMAKGIGQDHQLAEVLWDTGNVDAQGLATLIADPECLEINTAQLWLEDVKYTKLIDLFCQLVKKTQWSNAALKRWLRSKKPSLFKAGLFLFCDSLKMREKVDDEDIYHCLQEAKKINELPDDTKKILNRSLILIGIYCPSFFSQALNIAQNIGRVQIKSSAFVGKIPYALACIQRLVCKDQDEHI